MISIIIPVYNGAKYIDGLIENFQRQGHCSNEELEIVFVDDGSSDNSLDILQSYKVSSRLNISVYSQANAGVSAARNTGIKYAKGDYITFVDVDDFVTDDYIETLQQLISVNHSDVYIFTSVRVTDGKLPFASNDMSINPVQISRLDILTRMLGNPTKLGVYNLLLSKDLLSNNALSFSEGYKYYEDYDFLYRSFSLSQSTTITEKPLYFYLLRDGSAMQKFTSDRLTCLKLMQELIPWFKSHVPEFYDTFNKWGVARIYWSILWQACIAFQTYSDFRLFAQKTDASARLKKLTDYPDAKVRLSSTLYKASPFFYHFSIKLMSRGHSNIASANINAFFDAM